MAVQPKKKKSPSKSTTKKKSTSKKNTAKPRKRKKKNKSNKKRNILIILIVFMMVTFVGFGFYLGKNSDKLSQMIESGEVEGDYTTKKLLEDLSTIKTRPPKEKKVIIQKPKVKPKEVKKEKLSKSKPKLEKKHIVSKTALVYRTNRPKLAIVIDDVSKQSHLRAIKKTGVKMTPSIFPPSELSMTSHRLAKGLKHYMIHLPMESGNKQFNSQYKTLLTTFSPRQIANRVHELRTLFPHAKYINNHTGSVYTNDYVAMKRLYEALRQEGFIFIDSRTIGSSKVRKIAHDFGDAYVSRDIFIDNKHTVKYIHKQLKKAVSIAKKKGYAVAIGHPHKVTMQALASANAILKDVELVYIDNLYRRK